MPPEKEGHEGEDLKGRKDICKGRKRGRIQKRGREKRKEERKERERGRDGAAKQAYEEGGREKTS